MDYWLFWADRSCDLELLTDTLGSDNAEIGCSHLTCKYYGLFPLISSNEITNMSSGMARCEQAADIQIPNLYGEERNPCTSKNNFCKKGCIHFSEKQHKLIWGTLYFSKFFGQDSVWAYHFYHYTSVTLVCQDAAETR